MNILIIGSGATGSIAAKFLADSKNVSKVIIGDINERNAKKFLIPHSKIEFKKIDAAKKAEVLEIAKNCALIINAASSYLNMFLIEIALESGANYQDFSSVWDDACVEQFKFDDKFREKGLVALINSSATPGVSNLVVGEIAADLKQIEYIKIRFLENANASIPITAWSKEIAFDEITAPPYFWQNDKFIKTDNFSEEEVFDFPAPFINQKCYMIAQEDIGTIPRFIKAKYIDIKAGGSEIEFSRTLSQLGLLNKRPIKVGDAMISPYQFMLKVWPDVLSIEEMKRAVELGMVLNAHLWVSVEICGTEAVRIENLASKEITIQQRKKTLRTHILFPDQIEINRVYSGANYVSYAAGLCAAIFAEQIPNLKRKGVYSPEAIETEDRVKIFSELKKFGIKIETNEIK